MKIRTVHDMILIGLLALGLVGGFLYLGPTEAYANLLTNGDMETASGGDPASWTKWTPAVEGGSGSRDTTTYRQGTASAKETTTTTAASGCFYSQSFSASEGQVYVASVEIRSLSLGSAEAFLKVEFKSGGASGTVLRAYESPHLSSSNTAWERHTVVGIAPAGTDTVQMNLVTWTAVAGTVGSAYFDDADLHLGTTATLFNSYEPFYNSGFEIGGAGNDPSGWGTWDVGETHAINATPRTGTYSVKIGTDATAYNHAGIKKEVPIQGGQLIEATVWVKTESLNANTDAYIQLDFFKSDNSIKAGDNLNSDKKSTALTGTNDWTQLSVSGVAPPLVSGGASGDIAYWLRVNFVVYNARGAGTAGTYAYFDDLDVKVTGGFGQKTVANTPNVLASTPTSGSWLLTFDEGWGGNISSYYDYSVGSGTYHMIADNSDMHHLFDINVRQGPTYWPAPGKNQYGRLTVIEQSLARTVMQAYAFGLNSDKTTTTGTDWWTITYTVYPNGRVFVRESVTVGSVAFGDGPYWGITQENASSTNSYLDTGTNDTNRQGALMPDTYLHDIAMWLYDTSSPDVRAFAGGPVQYGQDAGSDRVFIELVGDSADSDDTFTAGTIHTHHWMLDLGEVTYDQTILDNKGRDYKTHTAGTYSLNFTNGTGSLLNLTNSINTDVDQDGFDEGAGCWNIQASSNGLRFILQANATYVRYKPAFFITGYTDTQLPASIEVRSTSDTTSSTPESTVKEQGTDYNVSFVPFSRVYERYASAASFSTLYANGFNNKTATITVNNPDYPVNATTTDYASWLVNTDVLAAAGVLDVWGFALGSKRDVASCTVYATYYANASSGTGDPNNIYGFVSDFDYDGTFGEASPDEILESKATVQATETTASQAIASANLTDTLLRKLEVRAYTDLVLSNDITFVAAGTEGTASGLTVVPGLPSGIAANDILVCVAHSSAAARTLSMNATYWTEIVEANGNGTSRLAVYWHRYDGATSPDATVTRSGTGAEIFEAGIAAFRNCDASGSPFDVIGTTGGGSDSSIEHTSITPNIENAMLLAVNGASGDLARTLAGYTTTFEDTKTGTQNSYGDVTTITKVGSDVQGTIAAGAGTVNITLPSGLQLNDVVIVATACDNATGDISGYTDIRDDAAVDPGREVSYKIMGSSPDSQVTIGQNATLVTAYVIQAWRGVDTTNVLDVSTPTEAAAASLDPDAPSITPVTIGALVIAIGMQDDDSSSLTSYPTTGYSNSVFQATAAAGQTANNASVMMASKIWSSGAEDPSAWVLASGSDAWEATTIALRPDASSVAMFYKLLTSGAATGTVTVTQAASAPWTSVLLALKAYNFKTCYLKNAYISGTYNADDITDTAAAFNTNTEVFSAQNDYLYVGSLYKYSGVLVNIYSAASATINPTWEYYNGSAWTTLTVTDNTSGFTKDGMVTFTAPGSWTAYNKTGDAGAGTYIGGDYYAENLYYVRIKRQAASITAPQIIGLATNNLILQYMSDVSSDTEFALVGATLVDLLDFDAIGYFGKVKLFWTTGSEFNNIGFNILRSEDAKNYVKVNKEMIPGLGTNIMGKEYLYEDIDVVNGKTYYYLLEDVESGGKITKHGPVTARPGRDSDADGMTDDWEYHYGLPATIADANVDSDDDGLTNIEEFSAGTDPLVIDSQNVIGVSETSGVKVIESAGLRTVLELDTTTLKVTNKNVDGVIYHVITLPEYTHGQTTDVGKPQIPTKGVLLGTLSRKPVTINILASEKEAYPGYNIYPVPKAALVEDPNDPAIKRLTYEFYKDTNAYAIDAFYPGRLAEVDYSNYLQGQQVIKVIFYPVQFNPVKGTLEFYKKIKLEVLQEGADLGAAASAVTPKTALPLTADNAYKIYINENGIYRLTGSYLESQGISLSGLDPRKLKIYDQGAEIPIYLFGEEDGQFGASDYIEFYGQAVDTRYTGTNVYWLVLSDGAGLRMAASGQVEDAATTPGGFLEMYRGEDNTLYWMEAIGQDHWFIDSIYGSQVYNFTLNLDGVANTADEAAVKIALEGSVYSGAAFTHHLYARLNGYPIADVSWQGANENIIEAKFSQTYLTEGANTITLEVGEDPTGWEEILVNWVEVSYLRNFTAKDNTLAFGNYTGGAYQYRIGGFTAQDIGIYDITDPKGVQRITQFTVLPEGAAFAASFKDIGSKEYVVLTGDKARIPSGIVRDEPSNLADKHNRADYIIITHPDFYETILPFADYRSKQGLKVMVVKLDNIYDEFNYGIADVNAVKDFLKYAYSNWTGPKPAYVLLVGDATYDYRDYSGYGFTNYVPAYLVHSLTFGETGSDNWFVCFDGDSDVIPDMLIGRFPVKTTDELKSMIDKIIAYEAISPDEAWTKKMLLVADNDEKIFADTSEELASYLTKGYTADKQYFGTTTNSPAALKQNIINSINEGRLFVNYTGHGGIGLWANERLFTWDDIISLYNRNALPVFTTLTCANGYFVYPRYVESLGERLVNASSGGAIAAFVPSGISYPTTQAYLAQGFYGAYFKDRDAILGSMVARGKLSVYENESGGDAINVIQTFNLFGDPALRVRMKAPQIPAVAAPEVFNLDKGKVNDIFRLTQEPEAAESAELGTVIVDKVKDTKKGLTKIILAEEAAPASPSPAKGSLEGKAPAEKVLSTEGIQLEDKTASLAPPKWRVLSKADSGAKPLVKIDYGAIEKRVTRINEDAGQLAELEAEFDEAIKAADLQKATSILRVIAKLARKIYWRTF